MLTFRKMAPRDTRVSYRVEELPVEEKLYRSLMLMMLMVKTESGLL